MTHACEIFHGKSFDPEAVMTRVSEMLEQGSGISVEQWSEACDALARVAPYTWWHCSCDRVSPVCGEVDAICPKCGGFRQLGLRLSRSPWAMYIRCLKHVFESDWFDHLGLWLESAGLGARQGEGLAKKSEAYLGEGPNSGAGEAYALGGAAVECKAQPNQSSNVSERIILCLDGMRISSLGMVCGTQWIALPMPTILELQTISNV